MRRLSFALLSCLAVACGDDGNPSTDAADTAAETFVPDTTPGDTTGDTSGGNRPPELERIGDRSVAVGQTLSITLSAKDPDDDKLTYSVFGNLPEGARFDKGEHRFEWAPTEANKTVFLTFVVSDGTDFDRETVRIQVTATATSNPPSFTDIGDQSLRVNEPYQLQLVATDPDGDRLSFGHEGSLPSGAALEEKTGKFTWTPGADTVGQPVRITFTVSDGTASDTLAVRFVVDDGTATARPPELKEIAPKTVKVGETLTFTLEATDPDGDSITFLMQHEPAGATLTGANFSYTPSADQAGQTYQIAFAASDGTFSDIIGVQVSVTSGQTGSCTPDTNEPNEDVGHATALPAGTRQATLCETETTYDYDYYAVSLAAGQELSATLTFDGAAADLDLALVDANDLTLAISDGVAATESLKYGSASAQTVYLVVYGYALEPLALGYTLTTSLGEATVCADDGYEDNDAPAQAKALDDTAQNATHQICANDVDYWSMDVGCGSSVEVIMDITGGVDLDMYLYDTADASEAPVASAFTESASEYIEVPNADRPGKWVLRVEGYPETTEGGYQLITAVSGGCPEDSIAGSSKANAKALQAGAAGFADLVLCCRDDWFSFSLAQGDQVTIDFSVFDGSVGAVVYAADGTTRVASKDPSPNGGLFLFSADAAGTYYLKTTGTVGTTYGFEWDIRQNAGGCTLLSCDKFDNCNTVTGECEPDPWCNADTECQPGFVCREAYCVNPCQSAFECRPEYACKTFDDQPPATYCGAVGAGGAGADCSAHADCAGTQACVFDDHGGYCADLDCGSCGEGTKCATVAGLSLCAKTCNTTADCRQAEGYICSAEKTCLPQNP